MLNKKIVNNMLLGHVEKVIVGSIDVTSGYKNKKKYCRTITIKQAGGSELKIWVSSENKDKMEVMVK